MLIISRTFPVLICFAFVMALILSFAQEGIGGSHSSEGEPAHSVDREALGMHQDAMTWFEKSQGATPGFEAGELIRQKDLGKLRHFVPSPYLDLMDFPEVEIEIQRYAKHEPHALYRQATLKYSGQTQLADDFTLKNYVAGSPFSTERVLAASDKEKAYMIAWNNVHRWQHFGYKTKTNHQFIMRKGAAAGHNKLASEVLLGGGALERHLTSYYQRVYLSHLVTKADSDFVMDVEGSGTLRYKDVIAFSEPFDMRGATFVIERSDNAHERDQVNSYLPTQRRVRRLSPKERADRFVGTEFTLDDFEGFSGRVLDYEWKFLGERDILAVADSRNSQVKMYGPSSRVILDQWQLRPCYVVEQEPFLKEHTYGKKILFVDKETYNIALALIYDRDGRILKILNTVYQWPDRESLAENASPGDTVPRWRSNIAINLQTGIHTVVWSPETEVPDVTPAQVRRLFSVSNLTGGR